jgi:hypothetical protein
VWDDVEALRLSPDSPLPAAVAGPLAAFALTGVGDSTRDRYNRAMPSTVRLPSVDRSAFSVEDLAGPSADIAYWASRTMLERLEGIEVSRQAVYGYDPSSTRLSRVLEITQLSQS